MADRSHRVPMKRLSNLLALLVTLAMVATACSGGDDPAGGTGAAEQPATGREPGAGATLTVYARTQDNELLDRFEQETGITVLARAGQDDDLAEQIIEDGAGSPADVFWAPLSNALGLLSAAGRLAPLSDQQLDRVPAAYRSPEGSWVGVSGRAHVVYYNTVLVDEDDLPDSLLGFADPAWRGHIAWDPNNRSLQDAITAIRQLAGEQVTREWLQGIQANASAVLSGPRAIATAVAAGEIAQVGFGNSFYLYDLHAEGDATNVAAKFLPGDPGGLIGPSGVGIVDSTDNPAEANAFVDFMLSPAAQRHLAEVHLEIPFVEGVPPPAGVPTAGELVVPDLDMRRLETLASTRELLAELGLIR